MAEPALACHALHCRAGGRALFTDLSFQVHAGERLALMGPSGSGKTTLLTTLAGLLPPVGGQVLVGGVPLAENPGLRREIALVLQSYGLLTLLTAAENIEVVLRAAGRDPRRAIAEAAAALADAASTALARAGVQEGTAPERRGWRLSSEGGQVAGSARELAASAPFLLPPIDGMEIVGPESRTGRLQPLIWQDGQCDHVEPVAGRCPENAREIMVSEASRFRLGSAVRLTAIGSPSPGTASGRGCGRCGCRGTGGHSSISTCACPASRRACRSRSAPRTGRSRSGGCRGAAASRCASCGGSAATCRSSRSAATPSGRWCCASSPPASRCASAAAGGPSTPGSPTRPGGGAPSRPASAG